MENIQFKEKNALVILATQRSGSTLLCSDIAKLKCLGTPNEHFLAISQQENKYDPELVAKFMKNCNEHDSDFFAIKLMQNYLHEFSAWIQNKKPPTSPLERKELQLGLFTALQERFDKVHYILLERESLFDQALSRYKAQRSNIYHMKHEGGVITGFDGNKDKPATEELDMEQFLQASFGLHREKRELRQLCKEANINLHAITYDEVVNSYPNYLIDFVKSIGIEQNITPAIREFKKVIKRSETQDAKAEFMIRMGML